MPVGSRTRGIWGVWGLALQIQGLEPSSALAGRAPSPACRGARGLGPPIGALVSWKGPVRARVPAPGRRARYPPGKGEA